MTLRVRSDWQAEMSVPTVSSQLTPSTTATSATRGGTWGPNPPGPFDPNMGKPTPDRATPCAVFKGAAPPGFWWEGAIIVHADGSQSDTCRLVPINEDGTTGSGSYKTPAEALAARANRNRARDEIRGLFEGLGFTTDFGFTQAEIDQLFKSIDSWIIDGWTEGGNSGTQLLMKFRTSDETKQIYQKRFGGMAELSARGQAISEAEYVRLEGAYRNVMSNYGLPTSYYDTFDDYARLIGAGLSVNEVEQRVVAAKQAMNPLVAEELKQYYDVTDGDLTAYMLGLTDEQGLRTAAARNQDSIRKQSRAAQIGAAGERAGFNMDRMFSESLGGTSVGQTLDPFQLDTLSRLEGTVDRARRVADRETTLAGIENETFDQRDALSAAFGDDRAKLASERRARRERARFSGSSGTAATSLNVERNF